jgi:hypothetical protein
MTRGLGRLSRPPQFHFLHQGRHHNTAHIYNHLRPLTSSTRDTNKTILGTLILVVRRLCPYLRVYCLRGRGRQRFAEEGASRRFATTPTPTPPGQQHIL